LCWKKSDQNLMVTRNVNEGTARTASDLSLQVVFTGQFLRAALAHALCLFSRESGDSM
jgi:hypothetical protein